MHKKDNYVPEPGARYESGDLNMKPLMRAIGAFFVFTIISCIVTVGLFEWLVPGGFKSTFQPQGGTWRRLPPPEVPKLQNNITVKTDIAEMRAHEHDVMTSYSWVNRNAGIAHVPIDRAIDLASQNGLPDFSQAKQEGTTKP